MQSLGDAYRQAVQLSCLVLQTVNGLVRLIEEQWCSDIVKCLYSRKQKLTCICIELILQ